jgi:hypothetical protein
LHDFPYAIINVQVRKNIRKGREVKKHLWSLYAATLLCSVGNAAVSPEVEKSVEADRTHLLTTFKQIHKNPELESGDDAV